MSDIIKRLEAASGPDRKLDAGIVKALYPDSIVKIYIGGDDEPTVFHAEPLVRNKLTLPPFTSSIDAAMTLVDENMAVDDMMAWPEGVSTATILGTHAMATNAGRWHGSKDGKWHGTASTLPIAICIAALRSKGIEG